MPPDRLSNLATYVRASDLADVSAADEFDRLVCAVANVTSEDARRCFNLQRQDYSKDEIAAKEQRSVRHVNRMIKEVTDAILQLKESQKAAARFNPEPEKAPKLKKASSVKSMAKAKTNTRAADTYGVIAVAK